MPNDTLSAPLPFQGEDDHGTWHSYNRALYAILHRPDAPTLTTAMRQAAQACGMEPHTKCREAPPNFTARLCTLLNNSKVMGS